MTILLTSGTGKTATAIAHLLKDANEPVLFASRKGVVLEAFKGVRFDWYVPSIFENVFAADPNNEHRPSLPRRASSHLRDVSSDEALH